jgi:two-component system sensor histidine kinase DegS
MLLFRLTALRRQDHVQAGAIAAVKEGSQLDIFEGAQCPLFLLDAKGRILRVNRRSVTLTGFSRAKLESADIRSLIVPFPWEAMMDQLRTERDCAETVRTPGQLASRRGNPIQVEVVARRVDSGADGPVMLVLAHDVSEEHALRNSLRDRVRRAASGREHERKRIARALHDQTIQGLLATVMTVDELLKKERRTLTPLAQNTLRRLREELSLTVEAMRDMIGGLRADEVESGGLVPALELLLSRMRGPTRDIAFRVQDALPELTRESEFLLYRIAQEAFQNIARHSQATTVRVQLEAEGEWLKLSVADNGVGFDAPGSERAAAKLGALGLQGMYERASLLGGVLQLTSQPDSGTTVSLCVPLSIVAAGATCDCSALHRAPAPRRMHVASTPHTASGSSDDRDP